MVTEGGGASMRCYGATADVVAAEMDKESAEEMIEETAEELIEGLTGKLADELTEERPPAVQVRTSGGVRIDNVAAPSTLTDCRLVAVSVLDVDSDRRGHRGRRRCHVALRGDG